MKIEFIDQNNTFLPDVINLGKKYSTTLGFMPEGGFIEYAKKNSIIIAYDKTNLIGYLMFRTVVRYLRVTIVHLCIKEEFRGHDISTKLLDALREKFMHKYSGMSISCRSDYLYATKLWQRYGFISMRRERSRSIEEKYLNKWWYDFNQPDLFSLAYDTSVKIKVLLDSNIVFKLRDEINSPCDKSNVISLLSDWLADEVDYFFSSEIHNEILRDNNTDRVEQTRKFITNFNELRFDIELCKDISRKLKAIIPGKSENDESDRKYIASCIASGISYFITLDDGIISKSEEIESEYDVQIFTPVGFILEIDQLINKEHYSPQKIAGVISHTIKAIGNDELNQCIDMFLMKPFAEKKTVFCEMVNSALTSNNSKTKIIKYEDSPVAFFSSEYKYDMLIIPFIRILDKGNRQTLFMQIIFNLINEAIKMEVFKIKIMEKYFSEYQKNILKNFGFVFISDSWNKLSINSIIDSSQIHKINTDFLDDTIIGKLTITDKRAKEDVLLELERKFYPLKFCDLDIPCYIIPILPYWAGQLFDDNISNQTLFGADPEKLWNIENVYYRHTRPITEIAPARILWYASNDDNIERSQSIIATSYLNEVMTDKPKILFHNNRHYGVYEWSNIYDLCNRNIEINIRALRFSHTEVFPKPIKYEFIQQILISNGRKKNTFPSPLRVNRDVFNQIYRKGMCHN